MTDEKPHILVVDDDDRLRNLLERFLSDRGFWVTVACDAKDARVKMRYFSYDLMILDVMMPGETGVQFAQTLEGNVMPIIMLTAMSEVEDRIEGLQAGADDYLTKPFEPEELVLRIRNILRRVEKPKNNSHMFQFGTFVFDRATGQLYQNEENMYLTTSESLCLKALTEHVGQPVSREELVRVVNTGQSKTNERSIDVQINRLRKKIEPEPGKPSYIQTVRNAGYVLHASKVMGS